MVKLTYILIIACTFLWIGFVCAISFMEAWLKFRAPGITVPLGLGIGRLVFNALNKIEWIFLIIIAAAVLLSQREIVDWNYLFILIPLLILFVQSWYLLPELDSRAEMHIRGWLVPPSNLHMIYVGVEFIKITSLLVFGISFLGGK